MIKEKEAAISVQKPSWLRTRIRLQPHYVSFIEKLKNFSLHTVCAEAHCPNQMDCFNRGTATFLLLGPFCTRKCTFCAVRKDPVLLPDPDEPERIARAVSQMGIKYCVLTMVTRDDLPDGGADHIVSTVKKIREECPGVGVEILISDLNGNWDALRSVVSSEPEVLNHNIETVPRLYNKIRPQANYLRSMRLLNHAASQAPSLVTKSGLMLGLGETKDEILNTQKNLLEAGCQLLTLGQYLAPSKDHYPVIRLVPPQEFEDLEAEALSLGFSGVASAPLVRSSYRAQWLYQKANGKALIIDDSNKFSYKPT
jgi:lipoic acid synthetase